MKLLKRRRKNITDPYGRTTWSGKIVDNRTYTALRRAEKKAGFPIVVVQGSYNVGVAASAGTHDKGGVVDIQTWHLTRKQRIKLVRSLKKVGFAAWYRSGSGWVNNEHVHAVLRKHKNLAWLAAQQEVSYDNRRDGLAGNRYDPTWRPKVRRHWSHRRNRVVFEF